MKTYLEQKPLYNAIEDALRVYAEWKPPHLEPQRPNGRKRAAMAAANALITANTSLKRMADAALGIHADYQDAREQTQRLESQNTRLEGLILQLQADVRELRQRLNGGSR